MAMIGPFNGKFQKKQSQNESKVVKKSVRFSTVVCAGFDSETDYNSSPTTSSCSSASKSVANENQCAMASIKPESSKKYTRSAEEIKKKLEAPRGRDKHNEASFPNQPSQNPENSNKGQVQEKRKRKRWRASHSCSTIKHTEKKPENQENIAPIPSPKDFFTSMKLSRLSGAYLEPVLEKSMEESLNNTHVNTNQSVLSLSFQSKPRNMEPSPQDQLLFFDFPKSLSQVPISQSQVHDSDLEISEARKSYYESLRDRNQELETRLIEMQEKIRKLSSENDMLVKSKRKTDEQCAKLLAQRAELIKLREEDIEKQKELELVKKKTVLQGEITLELFQKKLKKFASKFRENGIMDSEIDEILNGEWSPVISIPSSPEELVNNSSDSSSRSRKTKKQTQIYPSSARFSSPSSLKEGGGPVSGNANGFECNTTSRKRRSGAGVDFEIEKEKEKNFLEFVLELFGWSEIEDCKAKLKEVALFQKYCENFYVSLDEMMSVCDPCFKKEKLNGNQAKSRGQTLRNAWRFLKQMMKEYFELKKMLKIKETESEEGRVGFLDKKQLFKSYAYERKEFVS